MGGTPHGAIRARYICAERGPHGMIYPRNDFHKFSSPFALLCIAVLRVSIMVGIIADKSMTTTPLLENIFHKELFHMQIDIQFVRMIG